MSLTLIKEDGTGVTGANSYASVADCDAYHEGHTHATVWTAASAGNKAAALVYATRLIDACYQFRGAKTSSAQALQWPRLGAFDPDRAAGRVSPLVLLSDNDWPEDEIPAVLVQATCEQARAMLATLDRTADPAGEGIKQLTVVGSTSITFNERDRPPIIVHLAQRMLSKLGRLIDPRHGTAKLQRV